jgi:uncharacterized membrane protein YbhN (UPF0104 family)
MEDSKLPGPEEKRRSRILNVLRVVVSVGVLAILVSRVDLAEVRQLLADTAWLPFLVALGLFLLGALVRAYRWGVLVWALGVRASWWRLVGLYFVGAFFSQFLPTGVGGDAVKMYELSHDDERAAAAISSVLVDRFLGLFVLFAIALLALAGGYELVTPQVRLVIALVFVASLVGAGLLLQRTWIEAWGRRLGVGRLLGRFRLLRELYESIHLYGPVALSKALVASVGWNLILVVAYYLLGQAVGINLSLWYYFLFVPIISVLLMIPSLGGLGVREGATVILFRQVGVPESQAFALALAYDVTLWTTALIGAGLYILQGIRGTRRGSRAQR